MFVTDKTAKNELCCFAREFDDFAHQHGRGILTQIDREFNPCARKISAISREIQPLQCQPTTFNVGTIANILSLFGARVKNCGAQKTVATLEFGATTGNLLFV